MKPSTLLIFLLLLPTVNAIGFMNLPQQREFTFEPDSLL
jgi:hypothetical protein